MSVVRMGCCKKSVQVFVASFFYKLTTDVIVTPTPQITSSIKEFDSHERKQVSAYQLNRLKGNDVNISLK